MKHPHSKRKSKLIKRFLKGALSIDCNRVDIIDGKPEHSPRGTSVKKSGTTFKFKNYNKILDSYSSHSKIQKFIGNSAITNSYGKFNQFKLFGISYVIHSTISLDTDLCIRKNASKWIKKNLEGKNENK